MAEDEYPSVEYCYKRLQEAMKADSDVPLQKRQEDLARAFPLNPDDPKRGLFVTIRQARESALSAATDPSTVLGSAQNYARLLLLYPSEKQEKDDAVKKRIADAYRRLLRDIMNLSDPISGESLSGHAVAQLAYVQDDESKVGGRIDGGKKAIIESRYYIAAMKLADQLVAQVRQGQGESVLITLSEERTFTVTNVAGVDRSRWINAAKDAIPGLFGSIQFTTTRAGKPVEITVNLVDPNDPKRPLSANPLEAREQIRSLCATKGIILSASETDRIYKQVVADSNAHNYGDHEHGYNAKRVPPFEMVVRNPPSAWEVVITREIFGDKQGDRMARERRAKVGGTQ